MTETYTKLFSTIVTSTIWQEDKDTKILWITMLAVKDAEGVVLGSVPGLANIAGLTVEECQKSLEKLKSPDSYSRTKDNEGRRIEEIEGGWRILNHEKYRSKGNRKRDYQRDYMREYRRRGSVNSNMSNSKTCETSRKDNTDTYTDINNNTYKSDEKPYWLCEKGEFIHPPIMIDDVAYVVWKGRQFAVGKHYEFDGVDVVTGTAEYFANIESLELAHPGRRYGEPAGRLLRQRMREAGVEPCG